MNKTELEIALEYTKKKHENDKLNTFDTDISMLCFDTLNVLENCIEIPSGATNGDALKAIFHNIQFDNEHNGIYYGYISDDTDRKTPMLGMNLEWLNAPYRKAE